MTQPLPTDSPVAWMLRVGEARHIWPNRPAGLNLPPGQELEPLYAAPQSQAALVEALTPSGDTKAAYMGEFSFDITETFFDEDRETFEEQSRKVYVPWTTIKEIMAAIKDRSTKATGEKP